MTFSSSVSSISWLLPPPYHRRHQHILEVSPPSPATRCACVVGRHASSGRKTPANIVAVGEPPPSLLNYSKTSSMFSLSHSMIDKCTPYNTMHMLSISSTYPLYIPSHYPPHVYYSYPSHIYIYIYIYISSTILITSHFTYKVYPPIKHPHSQSS